MIIRYVGVYHVDPGSVGIGPIAASSHQITMKLKCYDPPYDGIQSTLLY